MSTWQEFVKSHAEGGVFDGVVLRVVPFGAFVEVDGVEGLLPAEAGPAPDAGASVAVRIHRIDVERRRFSLKLA